jgi:hypothetical protein
MVSQASQKVPVIIPRIYIFLLVYGWILSISALLIGSISPLAASISMTIFLLWFIMLLTYHRLSRSAVFFVCVAWSLICVLTFITIYADIRISRSGDLLLYGALGDESRYLDALKSNSDISVIYNSVDVSGFYNTYLNIQRFFTLAGSFINGYYLFNIVVLTLGNVFLSLTALKLSSGRAAFSVFLLLTAMPEGYFWSLTLYKEILIYFFVALSIFFYVWGRSLYSFILLLFASLFRSVMVLNFIAEFVYRNFNKTVLLKIFTLVFIILSVGLFWLLFSDILDIFFLDTRVLISLGKINIFGFSDNSIILWLLGFCFVLLVPIIIMFQPTPFFIVSDHLDVYQLPWSDLVPSGLLTLPILSVYVIHSYTRIFNSLRNDIFLRFTFIYYFILSASFMFFTLRHRFSMAYLLLVGACIFLEDIRVNKVRLSFNQTLFYFVCGGFISYLVAFTKGFI